MPPPLRLNAVAFISPQNHPILIRTFHKGDELKYHYIAHTSLDVFEERINADAKATECYLGLLYAMDDVAVYGYMTPLKVKIIIALALTDSVVRDAEVIMIFRALHMAFYRAVSNPFLKLGSSVEPSGEQYPFLQISGGKWKNFRQCVDEISRATGNVPIPNS